MPPLGRARRLAPWPLTLDHVWLAWTLTCGFVVGVLLGAEQTDYWWTVKLGEGLWATRQLPAANPLAFTPTHQPYVEQQWLAQLVLAGVHALGGLEAALLLRGLVLAGVMGLLFSAARGWGATSAAASVAGLIALPTIVGGAAIRPQLLAILLFVLFLLGTSQWATRRGMWLVLPALMVGWVNVHGSFPLGLVLIGLALVARALALGRGGGVGAAARRLAADPAARALGAALVLCVAAIFVNPYGPRLLPWMAEYLRVHAGGYLGTVAGTEWEPTNIASTHGLLYFLEVLLVGVLLVRVGPPPVQLCLWLLTFGWLALTSVRHTLWWALAMVPALAWALTRAAGGPGRAPAPAPPASGPDPRRRGVPGVNAALVGGFLVVAVLSLPWLRSLGLLFGPERWPLAGPLPAAAADYIATLPVTRVFNPMDWGGYLAWRLAPQQRIFVDARLLVYPQEVYEDYRTISLAQPGWADRLAAHGVEAVVVDLAGQPALARALGAHPAWQPAYCDALAAVYVARGAALDAAPSCPPP